MQVAHVGVIHDMDADYTSMVIVPDNVYEMIRTGAATQEQLEEHFEDAVTYYEDYDAADPVEYFVNAPDLMYDSDNDGRNARWLLVSDKYKADSWSETTIHADGPVHTHGVVWAQY